MFSSTATRGHNRNYGFTLLELLVVLVIIGLLAGYVGPKYFSQIGKSEVKTTQAQIGALEKALDQYRIDTGHYPSTEQGLAALNAKPADEPRWDGPYLKKAVPNDPGASLFNTACRVNTASSTCFPSAATARPAAAATAPISSTGNALSSKSPAPRCGCYGDDGGGARRGRGHRSAAT